MAEKGWRYFRTAFKRQLFRGNFGSATDEMVRRRELKDYVSRFISQEGGHVLSVREMGILLKNPFRGYTNFGAVYLMAECRYTSDEGTWYICLFGEDDSRWLWRSISGTSPLPKPRENGGTVGMVWHVPFWTSNILVLAISALVIWLLWPMLQP